MSFLFMLHMGTELLVWAMLGRCAAADLRRYRVPNGAAAAGAAACMAGCWLAGWRYGAGEAFLALLLCAGRMAAVLLLCRPLYTRRMIGGGDIKLLALLAGFLGGARWLTAAVSGLFLAAILSLWKLWRYGSAQARFAYLAAYLRGEAGLRPAYYDEARDGHDCVVPLGACFCAGALLQAVWLFCQGR